MGDPRLRESYGYATLDPDGDVGAASYGTWRLTYVAGSKGVDSEGCIRVHTDSDTDLGVPQFDDPAGEDYMAAQVPEGARVVVLVENVRSLLLTVKGRALTAGERIT